MVEKAIQQPDCVQENDVNYCKKKQFVDRLVFNSSVCRKTVFTECQASRKDWTEWFNVSNSYKPVVSGKSFADVVRVNLGQKGRGQSTPPVGTQVASKPGEPLELFKESVKLSHNTPHHAVKHKAKFCKTTRNNKNENFLVCNNRFETLTEENLIADDLDMLENEIQAVDTGPGETGQMSSSFIHEQLQDCDKFDIALSKKKVDPNVIRQAKNCPDYVACKNQMGESFGVIPLSTLQRYKGPKTKNRPLCNPLQLHKLVKQFGCPNFLGARIPVVSNLNIDNWKFHLKDYWDKQLLDLLEFGFPLDFDTNTVLTSTEENHASATQFVSHVETYIKKEIKHGAILGPFEHKPIDLHVSPFMTRDKPDSDTRRTIVDLSWPKGQSVNAGVQKDKYLGSDFVFNYPSVDDIGMV